MGLHLHGDGDQEKSVTHPLQDCRGRDQDEDLMDIHHRRQGCPGLGTNGLDQDQAAILIIRVKRTILTTGIVHTTQDHMGIPILQFTTIFRLTTRPLSTYTYMNTGILTVDMEIF